ncbi:sigma-54-dependent Fis family transcriptional regulator [Halopseudomonas sp.]|uniref:sigma-54-dependent Fis family transcriptional regulator n=1 Tax=Halopseudomonas sp. TaxID=2901191 RepID=UPI0030020020|tara:strand:- start:1526 stop:3169 length:1644 start_codon:yes stop_codon:yes gene_type:complete
MPDGISQQMKRELVVILEMAKLLEKPLDASRTIQGILRLLSQLYGLNCGRVSLPVPATNTMEVRYSYGLSMDDLKAGRFTLNINQGVTGYVMRTGSIGLVPDVNKEPLFIYRVAELSNHSGGRMTFIAVPILESGTPIGVLSVQREGLHERPFDGDISLLRIAASMVGQVLRIHQFVVDQTAHLVKENQHLRHSIAIEAMLKQSLAHGILGTSPALMDAVRATIQVARSDAPVMLLGESGTGKEKFARMTHQQSDRREKPFICINCAAIPADLLESELFGHAKGAFTGASQSKQGKILQADGGTLFLDEIGDMPLALQAKLLRVLQEKKVDPVGSDNAISVDFRVITATHVNLQESVNQGRFRLDLFYRLHVVPVQLPPLRERQEDIRQLALHFLNELNHHYERNWSLDADAFEILERFDWPGNIRQLQNVLERTALTSDEDSLSGAKLKRSLSSESAINLPQHANSEKAAFSASHEQPAHQPAHQPASPGQRPYGRSYNWVNQDEAAQIRAMLVDTNNNQSEAARRLNLSLRQLRYRVSKLGIDLS